MSFARLEASWCLSLCFASFIYLEESRTGYKTAVWGLLSIREEALRMFLMLGVLIKIVEEMGKKNPSCLHAYRGVPAPLH